MLMLPIICGVILLTHSMLTHPHLSGRSADQSEKGIIAHKSAHSATVQAVAASTDCHPTQWPQSPRTIVKSHRNGSGRWGRDLPRPSAGGGPEGPGQAQRVKGRLRGGDGCDGLQVRRRAAEGAGLGLLPGRIWPVQVELVGRIRRLLLQSNCARVRK